MATTDDKFQLPPELDPIQQQELLSDAAHLVLQTAPQNWHLVAYEYKCIGRSVGSGIGATDIQGTQLPWDAPDGFDHIFWRLRVGMYRENCGTWFSAFFRVTAPDGQLEIYYNYTEPPKDLDEGTVEPFVQEQELFPRSQEHMPPVMKERLAAHH